MAVSNPHPDLSVYGRLEISRRTDGKFLAFVGNAQGTCGNQHVLEESELEAFALQHIKAIGDWKRIDGR